jgi:hypothetical protein
MENGSFSTRRGVAPFPAMTSESTANAGEPLHLLAITIPAALEAFLREQN